MKLFADLFFRDAPATMQLRDFLFVSPFAATFSLPLHLEVGREVLAQSANWSLLTAPAFLACYVLVDLALAAGILLLFSMRWRAVTQ